MQFPLSVSVRRNIIDYSGYNTIAKQFNRNVSHITDYYRSHPVRLSGDDFLFKLLGMLPYRVPGESISSYYNTLRAEATSISNSLKMTSAFFGGSVLNESTLYGPEVNKIFISVDEGASVGVLTGTTLWKDIKPLTIRHHTISSITTSHPLLDTEMFTGYAIIEINIPLLGIMYHSWLEDSEGETVNDFITQYLITAILDEHNTIAMFNYIINLQNGFSVVDTSSLPTNVPDFTYSVDALFPRIFEDLISSDNVEESLDTIPIGSYKLSSRDFNIKLPKSVDTDWVAVLSWIHVAILLKSLIVNKKSSVNKKFINRLKIMLRKFKSSNSIKVCDDPKLIEALEYDINILLS